MLHPAFSIVGIRNAVFNREKQPKLLYFKQTEYTKKWFHARKIVNFCEESNEAGRGFYESHGFRLESLLKDFHPDGDAAMYSKILKI